MNRQIATCKIDYNECGKRVNATEIADYSGVKLYLKKKFPEYFSKLILDYSADVPPELVVQCVIDTFDTFEELHLAIEARARIIGITRHCYLKNCIQIGLIEDKSNIYKKDEKPFFIFDKIKDGFNFYDLSAEFQISKKTAKRYIHAYETGGVDTMKTFVYYSNLYKKWLASRKGFKNVN